MPPGNAGAERRRDAGAPWKRGAVAAILGIAAALAAAPDVARAADREAPARIVSAGRAGVVAAHSGTRPGAPVRAVAVDELRPVSRFDDDGADPELVVRPPHAASAGASPADPAPSAARAAPRDGGDILLLVHRRNE